MLSVYKYLVFLLMIFPVFTFSVDYDPTLFSRQEAIALHDAELNGIVTPHSKRDLRIRRFRRRWYRVRRPLRTRRSRFYYKTRRWSRPAYQGIHPNHLPPARYRITRTSGGFILILKAASSDQSVLLLNTPVYDHSKKRWWVFALRSESPVPENSESSVLRGDRFLGGEEGLYYLTATSTIQDKELGRAFCIYIPRRTVYGYWRSARGIRTLRPDSLIWVRFYTHKYASDKGASRTFSLRLSHRYRGYDYSEKTGYDQSDTKENGKE